MPPPEKSFREPVGKSKPRGRPQKNAAEKKPMTQSSGASSSLAMRARVDNREEFDDASEPQARVPTI